MKKFKLLLFAFIALFASIKGNAQTFSLEKDSSKAWWVSPGGTMGIHLKAKNETASNIQLSWKFTDHHLDAAWTFEGGCDNIGCYIYSTNTNVTDNIASTKQCDFKFSYNGDTAAMGTKSYSTIEITEGTTKKFATFVAYKTSTGISSSMLQDNEVAIFPNPASNYIDVTYNASSDVKTIALYNLIGKVVSVYKVTDKNSARCEFSADMPSGIYVVRIADSKGNVIATRKITHQ
ncbi:MAG: T9SS type A sorting domain-containing protein [Phycisphaerales bacterium]|nr:T9SS type A sorting domain-containing protein [Phycisphaerales bacterium]